MVLLLAFCRWRATPVVAAVGRVRVRPRRKGLEVPNNDVFDILHLSVIVGNAIGLVIDVMTT